MEICVCFRHQHSFFVFFYRSCSALHRRSSTEILLDHSATFCRGVPQCLFFVSGHSRIRTHFLGITMRTCYHCATLTFKMAGGLNPSKIH